MVRADRTRRLRSEIGMRANTECMMTTVQGPEVLGDAAGQVRPISRYAVAVSRRAEMVGLNFHDLRREAGSRLLESGMPEHHVQRFLDHANLSTTSRYLKTTRRGMHEALTRVEERRNRCTRDRSCATVDREPH